MLVGGAEAAGPEARYATGRSGYTLPALAVGLVEFGFPCVLAMNGGTWFDGSDGLAGPGMFG